MTKIRAVVYTRVSTDKIEQATSLKFQKEYYTKLCEDKGYELIKIYTDEGFTGTNSKRTNFLEMMEAAGLTYNFDGKVVDFKKSDKKPLFDLIIAKDVSRFSRNLGTIQDIKLLKEKGVHILFENNNLNTKEDGYEDFLSIHLMFAERESRDKSKKMKWTLKHKADNNQFSYGITPYGYEKDKESGKYIINGEEAEIVKQMYDMYVNQNMGSRLICDYLNSNNIPTKKGNKKWVESTVNRMLASERYKGDVIVQRYTTHDITSTGGKYMKDENEWKVLENAIEPIIDKEIWEKAQLIKQQRVQSIHPNTKRGKKLSEDIFFKKIYCGKCGSHFTRISSNKIRGGEKTREITYMCYQRRKYKACDQRGVSYNVLEREFTNLLSESLPKKLQSQLNSEQKSTRFLIGQLDERIKNLSHDRSTIDHKVSVLEKQVEILTNQLIENNPPEIVVKSIYAKIEKLEMEKSNLVDEKLGLDVIEIEKEKERVLNASKKVEEFHSKSNFTFEDIVGLIEKITVHEDKKLEVLISIPSISSYYIQTLRHKKLGEEYRTFITMEINY